MGNLLMIYDSRAVQGSPLGYVVFPLKITRQPLLKISIFPVWTRVFAVHVKAPWVLRFLLIAQDKTDWMPSLVLVLVIY